MIHGVINIHKEKGYTSHDVVAKLRGILKQKKIGHTGTLDPDATGVLPVCLGKATKLCDMLTDKNKTYETVMLLGKVTDTQDISGSVLSEADTNQLTVEAVETAIRSFVGPYMQVPPMYSALKVNGKKLYELAREGIEIERAARPVEIFDIQILKVDLPRVRMRVSCSKGTYIRTLCHDIGAKLGCGACMEKLIRTKVSRFELEDSITLEEVQNLIKEGQLDAYVIPIDQMFADYETLHLKEEFASFGYNGNSISTEHLQGKGRFQDQQKVRIYDHLGTFIGVYTYQDKFQIFKIEKMFFERENNAIR